MDRIKIIHLDDHVLFTDGAYNLLKPQLANSFYLRFNREDDALTYMINAIHADEMPDLLITDLSHPGLNGYEFAKRIRMEERKWKRKPLPVLLLTMHDKRTKEVQLGLLLKVFNWYLPKSSNSERIIEVIKSVC